MQIIQTDMETENIYANVNTIKGKELKTDDIQQQSSETSNSGMRSADRRFVFQRWAAVGLFGVLLLTVIIALCVHYNTVIGNLEKKHNSHCSILKTNYTSERDQLEARYRSCAAQRDQSETRYRSCAAQRDQLETGHVTCAAQRDQLRKEKSSLELQLWGSCYQGWVRFNCRCYYISTKTSTWYESQHDCRYKGADLVIIESAEEQEFLNTAGNDFWIGLSDAEKEGTWKWVDGRTLNTGFWRTGEPNNANGGENCANSEPNHRRTWGWNDIPCTHKKNWICEMPVKQ
ncbi:hypothetical protein AAFF_G00182140 [Aldrovandia affinis]|uniref:C-type lectin domain-containing protein n=1 Tax=Aldrovandia affinis TaxID=143900 RepID=A0AAD7W717_9TELE|nr:hypothetical protein AAFF_G00182140 [Aldrovandia affinis]